MILRPKGVIVAEIKDHFEKFIEDICRREDAAKSRAKTLSESDKEEDHPQRKINRLYRERWQNRIRWRSK